MAVLVQSNLAMSAMGISVQVDQGVSGDNHAGASPTIPRAKTGSLTTRTDNDTGELTLEASHGVTTGASGGIDVYWEGGKRTGMTVGTVSGNVVPIDGGAGDNLPAADTEITAMVPQSEVVGIVGDNMVALMGNADTRASIRLMNGSTKHFQIDIESATEGYGWGSASGVTNPIAGDTVLTALMSHDDGVNQRDVRVLAVKV